MPVEPTEPKPAGRSILVTLGVPVVVASLGILGYIWLTQPGLLAMRDFVEYWSAAVVNLRQGNPYDSNELLPIQRDALGEPDLDKATMMWNPPWAVALVTPLGHLPAAQAHVVWLMLQFVLVLLSAECLYRVYGQRPVDRVIVYTLALFFPAFFLLMWYGQIGAFCLFGLAGFLYCHQRGWSLLAGVLVTFTALKPHLLFAFGMCVVLDAFVSRRGRLALLGGALTLGVAAGVAYWLNPSVYDYYRGASWDQSSDTHVSPKDWFQPIGSYWLRLAIDPERFSIQFVPTVVTAIVVFAYWLTRYKTWHWPTEAPRLIFASVIMAAYGAWLFDLVVLLVPVSQAAIWMARAPRTRRFWLIASTYVALFGVSALGPVALVLLSPDRVIPLHSLFYFSPLLLLMYLAAATLPTENRSAEMPQ